MKKILYRLKELTKKHFPLIDRFIHNTILKRPIQKVFTDIYQSNYWQDKESASGPGSNTQQTEQIRKELINILQRFKIKSILDAPCGDFNWMSLLAEELPQYYGVDIVEEIINTNKKTFENGKIKFELADITQSALPDSDLIIARDVLIHFSYQDISKALINFKKTKAKYILTTSFIERKSNTDIITGEWRPINLQMPPFNFPTPIQIINEKCTEHDNLFADKSLCLWELKDINIK